MRKNFGRVRKCVAMVGVCSMLFFNQTALAAETGERGGEPEQTAVGTLTENDLTEEDPEGTVEESKDLSEAGASGTDAGEAEETVTDGDDLSGKDLAETKEAAEEKEEDAAAEEPVAVPKATAGVRAAEVRTTISEGFVVKNDKTYYQKEDGTYAKNEIVTVDGKKYYLNASGVLLVSGNAVYDGYGYRASASGVLSVKKGWLQVGSLWYYSMEDGKLYTSTILTSAGIEYYLNEKGQMVTNKIVSIDGKYYYTDEEGVILRKKGWLQVGTKWYYLSENGAFMTNTLLETGGKKYCLGNTGVMAKNEIATVKGKKYYAGSSGAIRQKAGWFTFQSEWYYTESDGSLRCNAIATSTKKEMYYLGEDGKIVKSQVVKADGELYYAGKEGRIRTKKGWAQIDGKWYVVQDGGKLLKNSFYGTTKRYFLKGDGSMVSAETFKYQGKLYYAEKSGLVWSGKGWRKIGDNWYYSAGKGELMDGSILSYGGKNYYLKTNGQMAVSMNIINKNTCYAADANGVLKTLTGWFKIGSNWYRATGSGALCRSRFMTIGGVKYYFDAKGVMKANGFFTADEKLYYADKNGAVRTKAGWFELGKKKYYAASGGVFYKNKSFTVGKTSYYADAKGVVTEKEAGAEYYDPSKVNDTTWKEINGKRYHVNEKGEIDSLFGIDISEWQDEIDWKKVKNDGVDFAFVRVGGRLGKTGEIYEDVYGKTNIKKATAAGIPVGVYFFTQAVTVDEAIEEAKFTLNVIKGLPVTLPVVIDTENMSGGRHSSISAKTRTAIVKAFCETVEAAGYKAMYYAGMSWCVDGYVDTTQLTEYMHWCAQYWIRNQCDDYGVPYQIWQYSESVKIDGINGGVDANIWYLVH